MEMKRAETSLRKNRDQVHAPRSDSHQEYIEYLYDCADRWEQRGERAQGHLIRREILRVKRLGERRCPVCARHRLS